jgi:aminopeptidase N
VKLLKCVAARYSGDLVELYRATDTYTRSEDQKAGLEERKLKAVLLRTIIEMDTPEVQKIAEDHFREAWNMSDRVSALHCINLSSHPRRTALLDEALEFWKGNISAYSSYLAVIGAGVKDDVFDRMAVEEERPLFKPDHPGHSRSLYLPMGGNNRMLWTERGIRWMTDTVLKLSVVNENTAIRLLASFQLVHKLDYDLKPQVLRALEQMAEKVNSAVSPSVAGRIATYLG